VKYRWTKGVNVKVVVQGTACGDVTPVMRLKIQNWQATKNMKIKTRVPKQQEVS
jgi:hypothetical protein